MEQTKKLRTGDCSRRAFWLAVAGIAAAKLALCAFQQAYTWVGGAPLDDELMFRAANYISSGQWLGPYDYLTLSKSMGFAVWLALLNALRVPYLLGGQALWCAASLLAAAAFAPVLRRKGQLAVFALTAFLPSSTAAYTLRVYRDNIFPALCLLFFAGLAGALLRAASGGKRLWPWLLAAGAGLAAAYLTREDAGLFLLPFAALAAAALVFLLFRAGALRRAGVVLLPFGLLAAGVLAFCTLNYRYYGVFVLSDFSSGSFADAIGAMSRVSAAEEYTPYVTIPEHSRRLMYAACPELEPLEYWLEEDAQLQNDFRDPSLGDYRAGSFYWAIRRAAQFEGVYASAQSADAYWASVAQSVNARCEDGTLPYSGPRRSSTTPAIRAEVVAPTLAEAAKSAVWALTFQDCAPFETARSIGTAEDFAQWEGYLHCGVNGAAEAGRDTPYYNPWQKLAFGVLQGVRCLYAAAIPVLFLAALYFNVKKIRNGLKTDSRPRRVLWWLLLGFLVMAAYRCGMIAFVETASFGIGTSTMYLATVHPLLALYGAVSCLAALAPGKKEEAHGEPTGI